MSTPSSPVPADEAERIELPGGWYFQQLNPPHGILYALRTPRGKGFGINGTGMSVGRPVVQAFAAAMSPTPGPGTLPEPDRKTISTIGQDIAGRVEQDRNSRWLFQSRVSAPELGIQGNCTQAAVASLLGLELCEVPDFNMGDALAWHKGLESFFAERGYELLRIDSHRHFRGLYLAGGPSRRGVQHMIVMRDGKTVHDPYPGGFGLMKVEHVWVPVPFDPKAFGQRRFLCRVCSVECDTEHTDGTGSICAECCGASEDGHKYEYEASERRWECVHCNEPPPDDWYDDPRGE